MEFNQNQKYALAALAGLVIAGFGLWGRIGADGGRQIEVVQPMTRDGADPLESVETEGGNLKAGPLVVHVAGEVKRPDVYQLPPGSRVTDAIRRAGGATLNAQLDSLNLAAPLKDGEKVMVPSRTAPPTILITPAPSTGSGASPPAFVASPSQSAAGSTGKLKTPGEGTVNLNTADLNELQRLPGVGPSTAQKIIDYRNQIGRFSFPDQLMEVKGIGPKKFEKMRPFVSL